MSGAMPTTGRKVCSVMSTTFIKHSVLTIAAATSLAAPALAEGDWLEHAANPVTNPIFFESAQIQSEVRPLFLHHRLDDGFVGGGSVNVYALQLRYAVNDRLAIIATKDGYIDTHTPGLGNRGGWGDLAAGLKYALIRDDANQFLVTPGFTITLPTGNEEVFQGRGKGEWNAFVSALKGFGDFHVSANVGARLPNDLSKNTASLHYSAQVDYYTCQWFIPFVSINAFTTLNGANGLPITTEGFDLINFGSGHANGQTQAAVGGGFRSRLLPNLDLGFGYEVEITDQTDIFKDRFTVDVSWRF
jgi:hypothetical protein